MKVEFPELSIRHFGTSSILDAETVTYTTVQCDDLPWTDEFYSAEELYDVLCYGGGRIVPVISNGKLYPLCNVRSFEVDYDEVRNTIALSVVFKGQEDVLKKYSGMLRYVQVTPPKGESFPNIVPFLIGDASVCTYSSDSLSSDSSDDGESDISSDNGSYTSDSDSSSSDNDGELSSCDCCWDDACHCRDGGGGGAGTCKVCDCKCCVDDCPESYNSSEYTNSSEHSSSSDNSSSSTSSLFDEPIYTKTIVLKDGIQIMFLVMSDGVFEEYAGEFLNPKITHGALRSIALPNGETYSYNVENEKSELPYPFNRKLFFGVLRPNTSDGFTIYEVPLISEHSFSFLMNVNTVDIKFIEDQNRLLIAYKQYPDYVGLNSKLTQYGILHVASGMFKLASVNEDAPNLIPLLFNAETGSAVPMSSISSSISSSSISSSSSLSSSSSSSKCMRTYVDYNEVELIGRCQPSMSSCVKNDAADPNYDPNQETEWGYVKCCCPLYDNGDDPPDEVCGCGDCTPSSSSSCIPVYAGHGWDVEREWLDGWSDKDGLPICGTPAVLELMNGISMVFYYKPILSDGIDVDGGNGQDKGNDFVRGKLYVVEDNTTFEGSARAAKESSAWEKAKEDGKYNENCDYYFNVLFWSILDNKTGKLSDGKPVPVLGNESDASECKLRFMTYRRRYGYSGSELDIKVSYDNKTNILMVNNGYGMLRFCGYDSTYGKSLGIPEASNKPDLVPILFGGGQKDVILIYPQDCEMENSWSSSSDSCVVWEWSCESCCAETDEGRPPKDPVVPEPGDPRPPEDSSGEGGSGGGGGNPGVPEPCSTCDCDKEKNPNNRLII